MCNTRREGSKDAEAVRPGGAAAVAAAAAVDCVEAGVDAAEDAAAGGRGFDAALTAAAAAAAPSVFASNDSDPGGSRNDSASPPRAGVLAVRARLSVEVGCGGDESIAPPVAAAMAAIPAGEDIAATLDGAGWKGGRADAAGVAAGAAATGVVATLTAVRCRLSTSI